MYIYIYTHTVVINPSLLLMEETPVIDVREVFEDIRHWWLDIAILLMEKILHHLIGSLSHYLQGFSTIPGWLGM